MPVNARALLINNKTLGVDPLVDVILATGDNAEKPLYFKALELKRSKLKSMYVEACLLASSDYRRIATILELDPLVVEMYSKVYYDTAGLDKLSKMELLDVKDRQESMMKIWSLSQGLDFISWRLGGVSAIDPIEGLKELFSTATWKAREAIYSGNDTEASKEGLKWSKMSMDLARLLKVYVMNDDQARKDIELALADVVPEFVGFAGLDKD